eukprot:scaffold45670_cov36-Tisochrysis_lutea.AAC.2
MKTGASDMSSVAPIAEARTRQTERSRGTSQNSMPSLGSSAIGPCRCSAGLSRCAPCTRRGRTVAANGVCTSWPADRLLARPRAPRVGDDPVHLYARRVANK